MTDSPTPTFHFETLPPLPSKPPSMADTSPRTLTWLATVDQEIGVCAKIAAHVPEWRREAHPLAALICQRAIREPTDAVGHENAAAPTRRRTRGRGRGD